MCWRRSPERDSTSDGDQTVAKQRMPYSVYSCNVEANTKENKGDAQISKDSD